MNARAPWVVRFARSLRWAWRELSEPMVASGFGGHAFKGAEGGRLYLDWLASLMSPNEEVRASLRRLRARGRDMGRNTPEGSKYIDMFVTNVVGHQGFRVQPNNRNERGELMDDLNDELEYKFDQYADGPVTLNGRLSLVDHLQTQCRAWSQDGEFFARAWIDFDDRPLALEPIDADLVDDSFNREKSRNNPNQVRLGIETDQYGRRLNYFVLDYPEHWGQGERQHQVIPASEIAHVYLERRPGQMRGITHFAPVLWAMKQLTGYVEAELIAARISACKMGFLKKRADAPGTFDPAAAMGTRPGSTGKVGASPAPMRLEAIPGLMEYIGDLEFEGWDPDHPNAAYEAFVRMIKRDIASGLNVYYNAHANDSQGTSYSADRGFTNREHDSWRVLQHVLIRNYIRWIYDRWLEVSVLRGDVKVPGRAWKRFRSVNVMPRGWRLFDPQKDADYWERAIRLGVYSRTRAAAEMGFDIYDLIDERKREEAYAKQQGVSIDGLLAKDPDAKPPKGDGDDYDGPKDEDDTPNGNGNGSGRNRLMPLLNGGK